MTNHSERVARILDSHQDLVHVGGSTGALIKRDELLVLDAHADAVQESARRWVDRREDSGVPGVALLRLRADAGVDAAQLTHDLRGGAGAHRRTSVTPNHILHGDLPLLHGTPEVTGGRDGAPTPARRQTAPIGTDSDPRQITVGIFDTGIDRHPWFAEHTWYKNCAPEDYEALSEAADSDLLPETGHGTFIAGVLLQQAPDVYLRVQRVLDPDGVADELALLKAIAKMKAQAAAEGDTLDVVNLSLGCFTFDDRPSPVLADAVARLARHTVVVAAAGNDSSDRPFWPAALKDVVAVAALANTAPGEEPKRANFSNYGWWVDAAAPGVRIYSSFLTHGKENGHDFHGYARWSGTSFAAPYVAGKIAALMSAKGLTARDAVSELLDPAGTRIPDLGVVVSADR